MANGDILSDFQAAIKAIAAGRRSAASLHKAIYELPLDLPGNVVTSTTPVQNVDRVFHVPGKPRQIMPLADPAQVAQDKEHEKGFSPAMAQAEAERCLQCGLICYLREKTGESSSAAACC